MVTSKTNRRQIGNAAHTSNPRLPDLSPRVREIVDGLNQLCDSIEGGVPLEGAARARLSPVVVKPPELTPDDVRSIRESLELNQASFAEFLGVKLTTLRSWESGGTEPSPLARRFLDEIRGDREYWMDKLTRRTRSAVAPSESSPARRS
jgi:putative transcriptional regulator